MANFSTDNLKLALKSLEESIRLFNQVDENSLEAKAFRDSIIQRFEYCVELSWKTSMKILGSKTVAAKPAIREMGRSDLVSDLSLWMDFVEARNNTSHVYNENMAKKVLSIALKLPEEVSKLLERLQTHEV